jgi:hypothetical protein
MERAFPASGGTPRVMAAPDVEIGPLRREEIGAVAELHHGFFGGPDHAHSLARMGPGFLADVFYGPSFDNPHFHVDVARSGAQLVGFSVYVSDATSVFRRTLLRHPFAIAIGVLRHAARHPVDVARHVLHNVAFVSGRLPPEIADVRGHYLLHGVLPAYRGGMKITAEFWMRMERGLRAAGCTALWGAPAVANPPINRVFQMFGARQVATGTVQGIECVYYRKDLPSPARTSTT